MSVVLLLIPQGPDGLATRGSSRRPLRGETETVPGLELGLELSFSRCLLLITRRSCLLSFRGRVSQGQADDVIRAAFLAFLAAPRCRLVRCWNGQNGWQVAGVCCCCCLLLLPCFAATRSIGSCSFFAPAVFGTRRSPRGQGEGTMAPYTVHHAGFGGVFWWIFARCARCASRCVVWTIQCEW